MPAALAVSSIVGSRPISCSSFLETFRSFAHRLDHVHRNADRPGLVGDGPRDRLADPPGGVRRELVAAAVLVLVDRPHQARVAFLDQVEEAQARGCGTSWRSRPPAAGCRRRARAWPARTRRSAARSISTRLRRLRGLFERDRASGRAALARRLARVLLGDAAVLAAPAIWRSQLGPCARRSPPAAASAAARGCVRRLSSSTSVTVLRRRSRTRSRAAARLALGAALFGSS